MAKAKRGVETEAPEPAEAGDGPHAQARLHPDQAAEIEALRAASAPTRRASVPALEDILYQPLPVLDYGFVRVVDYMGDDGAIVQAARVSYGTARARGGSARTPGSSTTSCATATRPRSRCASSSCT
jgi:hypothetical protein